MEKLAHTISGIQPINPAYFDRAQKKLNGLTKPLNSLGQLEEIIKQIVAITENEAPILRDKIVFTLASDHGVTEEGVSAYPKEVTSQMVYNFIRGGAGINVLSRHVGARVIVVDIGVAENINVSDYSTPISKFISKKINYGTKNFTKEPAMTRDEAIKSIETGIELVEELGAPVDIIATGDMGIGNTTPSSAITSVITRRPVEEVTGCGTGVDDNTFRKKIDVIKRAIQVNNPTLDDPIDILCKLGGFEIGGLAGIMLASAKHRIPVVIDGFISGTAALIAYKLSPTVRQYFLAGHCSQEPGHKIQLEYLKIKPILELNMRLGEGTGAVLAMSIIEAAGKILTEMTTFEEAGVSKRK